MTRRKLGKVVMPVQVTAHHPRLLLMGLAPMELALAGCNRVDLARKELCSSLRPGGASPDRPLTAASSNRGCAGR